MGRTQNLYSKGEQIMANELLEHLRRIKDLLRSPLYNKDDLKKMSHNQIKEAHNNLFRTHNSRRTIK